jgi:hypothetical protein
MVLVTLLVSMYWKKYELSVNHVNYKTALLKFGSAWIKDFFNLAYKIDCEKHNEKVLAYELLLKSYGQYFDYLYQKTELSVIYLSEEFSESNISDLNFAQI